MPDSRIRAVVDDYCNVLFHLLANLRGDYTPWEYRMRDRDPLALAAIACDFPSLPEINKMCGWVIYVISFNADWRKRHGKQQLTADERAVLAAARRLSVALAAARAKARRG